jgi:hypothetical protein
MLDSKLCFHYHVNFVYSQAFRTIGLIRHVTYNFSSLNSLVTLYNALIKSKPEYAPVVWDNLTLMDSTKMENIQKLPICAIIAFLSLIFCVIMI